MRRLWQNCPLRLVAMAAALGLVTAAADAQQATEAEQPPANSPPSMPLPTPSMNCCPPFTFGRGGMGPSMDGTDFGTGMGDSGGGPSFGSPSSGAGRGSSAGMIGSSLGPPVLKTITVPAAESVTFIQTATVPAIDPKTGLPTTKTISFPVTVPVIDPATGKQATVNVQTNARVPNTAIGAVNIADDQSPIPQDRVFFIYNSFSDVSGTAGSFTAPHSVTTPSAGGTTTTVTGPFKSGSNQVTQTVIVNGVPTSFSVAVPTVPPPILQIQREVFGFEKTFLDGDASVGIRVPIFESGGTPGFGQDELGDISVFVNYAFYKDDDGNAFTGGLVVTAPTAPAVDTIGGSLDPTFFQPFLGYRWAQDDWYVLGFSGIQFTTDSRWATSMTNDIGVGYNLYRGESNEGLNAIIPTVEAHVFIPFNHRAPSDPFHTPDFVALTTGVHIGWGNAMLTLGAVTPVAGPVQFPIEATVQLNIRF
jgi:hypothetical protein